MSSDLMKIWAFCVFMPQKLQDMSSFLDFGGNSALLPIEKFNTNTSLLNIDIRKVLFDFGILTFSRAADDDYYYLKYVSLDKKQQVIEFLNTN